jgi:hypothetical protein
MRKSINLSLNNYLTLPPSLKSPVGPNRPISNIDIDIARLFHHYYLDTRGYAPPDPDLAHFEHLSLLLPCTEFRVRGDGFGTGTAFRKHRSNELGQALCRWFLYEHLEITYFAHMEDVLDRPADPAFDGLKVHRILSGDAPDYFCAQSASSVYLAEAKGRTSSVSFASAEFRQWRNQFDRVLVKDSAGVPRSVKGHIVATRFATEVNRASVKSTVFAEDPASPGEGPLREASGLGSMVIALHYADIVAKIRQPLLSASLRSGVPVPEEIQFPAAVWEFRTPPLQGKRFVGGYFPGPIGTAPIHFENGRTIFLNSNPWRLDVAPGTFFGVEESIFRSICAMGRAADLRAGQVRQFPDTPSFYSGISLLRDGSIIGPVEFFDPIGVTSY